MDAELRTRFEMYIADDAERWFAVHERMGALALAVYTLGLPIAAEQDKLQGVIATLHLALKPSPTGADLHPAFAAEIQTLIDGWEKVSRGRQNPA